MLSSGMIADIPYGEAMHQVRKDPKGVPTVLHRYSPAAT